MRIVYLLSSGNVQVVAFDLEDFKNSKPLALLENPGSEAGPRRVWFGFQNIFGDQNLMQASNDGI